MVVVTGPMVGVIVLATAVVVMPIVAVVVVRVVVLIGRGHAVDLATGRLTMRLVNWLPYRNHGLVISDSA